MASGPERLQAALDTLNLGIRVIRVPGTAKTAQQAADSVGCPVAAIVKSIVVLAGDHPVVVLCPGDRRVDMERVAVVLGVDHVGMAPAETVRAATGYAIGGVPPLGHATALPVYMDPAFLAWDTVYAAAGAPDALFPIAPQTLQQASGAQLAEIS